MKKSILKALLAVAACACLCFGAVACNISAGVGSASTETLYSQDLSYIISEDGSYYSVRGIGLCSDRKVVIPNEYRGLPVKEIIDSAFSQCTDLTSIEIPDSVTTIGDYAFEDCSLLTSVYYKGTASDWSQISIGYGNYDYLTKETRYYYSESQPTSSGNYWHYDENGNVAVW